MRISIPNFSLWVLILGFFSFSNAQFSPDIFDKYTSVGQLGMTVTNFGILGNGWDGQNFPSCQYKQHTTIQRDQVEHFSYAGLWIGGIVNGEKRVSTAIVDGVFESGDEGFEFFSTSGIDIRSSISSTSQVRHPVQRSQSKPQVLASVHQWKHSRRGRLSAPLYRQVLTLLCRGSL